MAHYVSSARSEAQDWDSDQTRSLHNTCHQQSKRQESWSHLPSAGSRQPTLAPGKALTGTVVLFVVIKFLAPLLMTGLQSPFVIAKGASACR